MNQNNPTLFDLLLGISRREEREKADEKQGGPSIRSTSASHRDRSARLAVNVVVRQIARLYYSPGLPSSRTGSRAPRCV
jgi:hypothetical protein